MANLNIQLDSDTLREATAQALLGILTEPVKQELIKEAIIALLQPKSGFSGNYSKIQEAFNNAVYMIVRDEATKYIMETPEVKEKLIALMKQSAEKMLTCDVEDLTNKMRDAFVKAIGDRY